MDGWCRREHPARRRHQRRPRVANSGSAWPSATFRTTTPATASLRRSGPERRSGRRCGGPVDHRPRPDHQLELRLGRQQLLTAGVTSTQETPRLRATCRPQRSGRTPGTVGADGMGVVPNVQVGAMLNLGVGVAKRHRRCGWQRVGNRRLPLVAPIAHDRQPGQRHAGRPPGHHDPGPGRVRPDHELQLGPGRRVEPHRQGVHGRCPGHGQRVVQQPERTSQERRRHRPGGLSAVGIIANVGRCPRTGNRWLRRQRIEQHHRLRPGRFTSTRPWPRIPRRRRSAAAVGTAARPRMVRW